MMYYDTLRIYIKKIMKTLLFCFLFPLAIFSQQKTQEISSVFKDLIIESDHNLFVYEQELGLLNTDISSEEQNMIKELHHTQSDYFRFDYKANLKPLHREPWLYEAQEYQRFGSKGVFYSNILGGLIETIFGDLTFKL